MPTNPLQTAADEAHKALILSEADDWGYGDIEVAFKALLREVDERLARDELVAMPPERGFEVITAGHMLHRPGDPAIIVIDKRNAWQSASERFLTATAALRFVREQEAK